MSYFFHSLFTSGSSLSPFLFTSTSSSSSSCHSHFSSFFSVTHLTLAFFSLSHGMLSFILSYFSFHLGPIPSSEPSACLSLPLLSLLFFSLSPLFLLFISDLQSSIVADFSYCVTPMSFDSSPIPYPESLIPITYPGSLIPDPLSRISYPEPLSSNFE